MTDEKPRIGAGDVELELDGETVVLRASLEAAQKLSRQSGGLAQCLQMVGALDMDMIARVVALGARIEGKEAKQIPNRIWKTGLWEVAAPCSRFLNNLMNGGKPLPQDHYGEDDGEDGGNPTEPAGS